MRHLDERTINEYFIGYPEKLKGYMFYCPILGTRIVEIKNVQIIKNGETSRSEDSQNVEIKEVRVYVLIASTSYSRFVVSYVVEPHNNQEQQQINDHEVKIESVVE